MTEASGRYHEGLALTREGRLAEAVRVYDEIVERYGESDDDKTVRAVGCALDAMAHALTTLDRQEQVLDACDELIRRFGETADKQLRALVASALARKAREEAVRCYDAIIERLRDAAERDLLRRLATTYYWRAALLADLNDLDGAIASLDGLLGRFLGSDDPEIDRWVAHALAKKTEWLPFADRANEAIVLGEALSERLETRHRAPRREFRRRDAVQEG